MALAGTTTIAMYAVVAAGLWLLARYAWANRPDPLALAATFLLATLLSGYLTYRFGTGRTLAGLDARELPRERALPVHRIVDALAAKMDVDRPRVFVARLGEPNALALGGTSPALVIDYSLFRLLSPPELEGVLAHELAHIEGRDALVQPLAHSGVHTLVGVVALALAPLAAVAGGVARCLALVRGAPDRWHRTLPGRLRIGVAQTLTLLLIGLTLLLRAYSRRREHADDDRAVAVTGRPLAMASALRKIDRASRSPFPFAPLTRRDDGDNPLVELLSTHTPVDDRIDRLRRRAEHVRDAVGPQGRLRDRSKAALRPVRPDRGGAGWTNAPIEER
jgi:heat shock protein HtpX